jgi:hypothetical protein
MYIEYNSDLDMYDLKMINRTPIRVEEAGFSYYTNQLRHDLLGGFLVATSDTSISNSICLTHNNSDNWHGSNSSSSGQILFSNGTINIRSSKPVQFGLGDAFYLNGLANENVGTGDEGDAYVVINISTNKLYYHYTGSDDRRKHNEVKINNALETIMKLEGFRYDMTETMYPIDYNGEIKDNYRKEAGFIAQSVLKIDELKFTVKGGDYLDNSNNLVEKSYQLNYNAIFTYSVVAIQELKRDSDNKDIIIAEQKNEIESLKEKNLVLENKVDILKNKLNELLSESGKETINF